MTEEEAKTKWCPYARVGSSTSGLGGFNRFIEPVAASDSDTKCRCIASACMAWRWDAKAHEYAMDDWFDAENIAGVQRGPEPELASYGYCGLAGKP